MPPLRLTKTPLAALLPLILLDPQPRVRDLVARQPAPANFGRITGTVEISSALTARRPRFRVYSDVGPGAVPATRQVTDIPGELPNVVVYLEGGVGHDDVARDDAENWSEPARARVMAQANERFEPHVLPVRLSARVEFPNRDDVYHNVFSLSRARTFDLGRYPKGNSKAVTFERAGVVQVFCHIHSDMSAVILVLPNPFYTSPDSSGHFVIDSVPPGEYTIVGWHERTKPASQRIHVVAGQTTSINFRLPLAAQAQR